ncbi:hypothetical protein MBLNU230_g6048t1 [Neophaeotheca triangularis]
MSSFFTLPASQKKRKRAQPPGDSSSNNKRSKPQQKIDRDESISGSDISDDDNALPAPEEDASESEDEEYKNEDATAKRVRLAEQYLANTQKEVLEHGDFDFDAADVDQENLRRRMGDRLKEDTAESKGKLYRFIADDLDFGRAEQTGFRTDSKSVTGVAVQGRFVYTVSKDMRLVKWEIPESDDERNEKGFARSRKPRKVRHTRGMRKQNNDPHADHHTRAILCVAASQDGKFVATGGADNKLIVWDAETLKPLKFFSHHRDSVTSLAFRRGTNQLFSASKDRTIKIWSLNELAYVETLFGHQDEVVDVSTLAQETCLTVGARDRTARFWKVVEESQLVFRGGGAGGKARPESAGVDLQKQHHEGSMDRVAGIDDETFVTASDNGSLSLWNINKKKPVFTYPLAHGLDPPLPLGEASAEVNPPDSAMGEPQPRWITALRAVPFSDVFVTGSWDGSVRAWKLTSDKRRIEALGAVAQGSTSGHMKFEEEGDVEVGFAVAKLPPPGQKVEGVINDLSIVDRGARGQDGVFVVAAVGKEHRLASWKKIEEAKNCAVLFRVPKKALDGSTSTLQGDDEGGGDGARGDFAGFD